MMNTKPIRYVVGCMTGTSLDGLDVALVRLRGHGLGMTAKLVQWVSHPLGDLTSDLRALATGKPFSAADYARIARKLGEIHAQAIQQLHEIGKANFIVAHGQTIWHGPDEGLSVQLLDPWPMVRTLGVSVCYDLRQADLVAKGQGAPITPLADGILFKSGTGGPRQIVNLGGICNVTYLPPEAPPKAPPEVPPKTGKDYFNQVYGEDIGPCNLMIDAVVKKRFGMAFDAEGKLASEGQVDSAVYDLMCHADFFKRPRPRTTGREDFCANWVNSLLEPLGLKPHDAVASVVDAVARLIGEATPCVEGLEVILAGGGALNETLVKAIKKQVACKVLRSDELSQGMLPQAREAMAMAVLGALCQDGIPITLSQITGSTNPGIAGCWAGGHPHGE